MNSNNSLDCFIKHIFIYLSKKEIQWKKNVSLSRPKISKPKKISKNIKSPLKIHHFEAACLKSGFQLMGI